FQVMLAFRAPPGTGLRLPRLAVRPQETGVAAARYDLWFGVQERRAGDGSPAGLAGTLVYRADLFERRTPETLAARLVRLLAAVAAAPRRRPGDVNLLGPEERRLLEGWNDTAAELPTGTLPGP